MERISWKTTDKRIVCPKPAIECKILEAGINRYRQTISHGTDIAISECRSCEVKGTMMIDPADWPLND